MNKKEHDKTLTFIILHREGSLETASLSLSHDTRTREHYGKVADK